MLHHLEYMINRFYLQPVAVVEPGREHYPVAIRRARDSDVPLLPTSPRSTPHSR